MQIKVESTHLNGVVVLAPEVFQDSRGFFMETYRDDQFRKWDCRQNLSRTIIPGR